MTGAGDLNRRTFLASIAASGGALMLGFDLQHGSAHAATATEITAWIVIAPDDRVTIRIAKSEMGQGVFTGLAMLVAEELGCDWNNVRAELATPHESLARNRVYGDMSTGGSRSIRNSEMMLRKAGATAREMLIAAAATRWGVASAECQAKAGVVTHTASGRTVRYGAIAEAAARVPPPAHVTLKDAKDWTLIGQPTRRLDAPDKVLGRTTYGIDVQLPGMLNAALVQCPVFKVALKSIDDTKARGLPGVRKIVALKDAVAVVADTFWHAQQAADALTITWDDGHNGSVSSDVIADFVRSGLDADEAGVGRKTGNVTEALAGAAKRIEAEYAVPFLAHATMEPQNCTAHVTPDRVEVWVPTQNAEASLAAAAQAAGVPTRNVVLHPLMIGGGFG